MNIWKKEISIQARVISASEGKVRVELEVTEELTNPFGTLHGGCTATLIDIGILIYLSMVHSCDLLWNSTVICEQISVIAAQYSTP